jgi:protoporphyrinogen IX oxidase
VLWVKALHIAFVVCWFAGLFYLPRLFVNHALVTDSATYNQLALMEQRLYRFVTPLAWLAPLFGCWLLYAERDFLLAAIWMYCKLALVAVLIGYHLVCGHFVRLFTSGRNTHGHVFYRWFNELPVVVLFGVVILVVVRPF